MVRLFYIKLTQITKKRLRGVFMNVVTVYINGIEYKIKGNEREEYIQKVARYVDSKMKSIMDVKSTLSSVEIATLTAVNAVDELFKLDSIYEELLSKTEKYTEIEKTLNVEIHDIKNEIDSLKNENIRLKQENSKFNSEEIEKLKVEIEKLKREIEMRDFEDEDIKSQLEKSRNNEVLLKNKLLENQIELVKIKQINNTFHNTKNNRK